MEDVSYKDNFIEQVSAELICPGCGKECPCNVTTYQLPANQKMCINTLVCDNCGFKDVKTSYLDQGIANITHKLRINDTDTLSRYLVVSDKCTVKIPELELEFNPQERKVTVASDLIYSLYTSCRYMEKDIIANKAEEDYLERYNKINQTLSDLKSCLDGIKVLEVIIEDETKQSFIFHEEIGNK